MAFAENTSVPVERTRAEIEKMIVTRHKCESFQSGIDFANRTAVVQFKAHARFVRFIVTLPNPESKEIRLDRNGWSRSESNRRKLLEQAERTIWRALLLVIKAKLEAVDSKIATFEDEFLAQIVLPNDQTVGSVLAPMIANAYDSGQMPSGLLALPAKGE